MVSGYLMAASYLCFAIVIKDKNKLMVFKIRCYWRILNVRWQETHHTENQGKEIKLILAHL